MQLFNTEKRCQKSPSSNRTIGNGTEKDFLYEFRSEYLPGFQIQDMEPKNPSFGFKSNNPVSWRRIPENSNLGNTNLCIEVTKPTERETIYEFLKAIPKRQKQGKKVSFFKPKVKFFHSEVKVLTRSNRKYRHSWPLPFWGQTIFLSRDKRKAKIFGESKVHECWIQWVTFWGPERKGKRENEISEWWWLWLSLWKPHSFQCLTKRNEMKWNCCCCSTLVLSLSL